MNSWHETKSVPVSRQMIWQAYKKVKVNKGGAGVDKISMAEFEANRSKHLYKLWNRMASGSYFPRPVKEVEIDKKDGKVRKLGIPNLTFKSIVGIAQYLNPYIRGWVNYYGKFRGYEMNQVFQNLRRRLVCWARKRYKRYKTSINRAYDWLERVRKQFPHLFYHWQIDYAIKTFRFV